MRLAGFLYCTNSTKERFNGHNRHGNTPFVPESEMFERKWQEFSLDDAFRYRLMLDLVGGESTDDKQLGGLGASYASNVVWNAMSLLPNRYFNEFGPRDSWAGLVVFEELLADDESHRFSAWYFGEIEDLPDWLEAKRKKYLAEYGQNRLKIVRIFLANATRAAMFVRSRAVDLGLPEGHDFSGPSK